MTEREAYEAGITKLGLYRRIFRQEYEHGPIDLRTDPAFAWRVQEALMSRFDAGDLWYGQCAEGFFCVIGDPEEYHNAQVIQDCDVTGKTLADALFAAVVALGKEQCTYTPASSRMCERGTKCCEVRHKEHADDPR